MKRTIHIITYPNNELGDWYEGHTHAACGAELVNGSLFDGIDHYLKIAKGQREGSYLGNQFFILTKDPGRPGYHLCGFSGTFEEHICGDCEDSDDFSLALLARVP